MKSFPNFSPQALHSFHIPVMGLAYTIDSPVRVAHLGISSTVSLGDDMLIERVRRYYGEKFRLPFQPIENADEDSRARRVTEYLNMLSDIVSIKLKEQKEKLLQSTLQLEAFINMLPDYSALRQELIEMASSYNTAKLKKWLNEHLVAGSIDVNIMTRLDKVNYRKGEPLPVEYNDAHASLRGFANSKLQSTVVFSAGMNPRLYSYIEKFEAFYPKPEVGLEKKIAIKVSDYRSALVQGKLLAKKGLWVSEYRIESGLNCGGHAFATQGKLMGPILEEFKAGRHEMVEGVFAAYRDALKAKNRYCPSEPPAQRIAAQGGVGTAEEHEFLLHYYELSSVGWGSPFLLVPEAVSIDANTLDQLAKAREEDLYLSGASPLGVPFNNLRNSGRQRAQKEREARGLIGNPCTKKFLVMPSSDGEEPICTASTKYQEAKIAELEAMGLSAEERAERYEKIVEKECLCGGLAVPFLDECGLETKLEGKGATVCPGPNIAYFDRTYSLKEMVGHIYGRLDLIAHRDRPHMFVKELQLNLDDFRDKVSAFLKQPDTRMREQLASYADNLASGIDYYLKLFSELRSWFGANRSRMLADLKDCSEECRRIAATLSEPVLADSIQ
ncbi:MAG: hypothetical protein KBF37_02820 [Saprospiraceae bacterium]|jgi:hypothetical protein|nr:hypothetical protein [Saprospiraceae bacterium]MBP9209232.1 hypothetical protein [Saprospiraceae bacterium]